ncbi:MAG: PD-(D/E)XK nuclease family protein, partial [Mariprofundaceae bacterium]
IEGMDAAAEQDIQRRVQRMLMLDGLSGELLGSALGRAMQAVRNTMTSERGRWILSSEHQDAHCEWPLSENSSGRCVHKIIDRSFVDKEGNRWIIDYKTASHEGGDMDAFLASEAERHSPQLQGYVHLLQRLEPGRPLRAALYFPMLDAWYELPERD